MRRNADLRSIRHRGDQERRAAWRVRWWQSGAPPFAAWFLLQYELKPER
jgi:hypothetical protein